MPTKATRSNQADNSSDNQPVEPTSEVIDQPVIETPTKSSTPQVQPQTVDQNWPDKVFWATIFIGGGILLIGINLGYLPWPDWTYLISLWPVLLILAGLHIFLNKSQLGKWAMTIISLLVIFASVGYAMLMSDAQLYRAARDYAPWLPAAGQHSSDAEDSGPLKSEQVIDDKPEYNRAAQRTINLDMGLGRIDIQPADINRQIELYSQGQADNSQTSSRVNVNDDQVVIDVDINTSGFGFLRFGRDNHYLLDIGQVKQLTDLNVDLGAGNANLNFDQDFNLQGGHWQVGAGNLTAKLGSGSLPRNTLKLEVGVGKMTLYVPSDIGLQIKHDVGIGSLEVFGQKIDEEGTFTSEGYDQKSTKVTLEAEVGVGSLIITQLP